MLFSALFRKNISSLSDLALLELVRKDSANASGELFKRYAALVMGLCLKYMNDSALAEDLMMSIFEKLPGKIHKHDIQNFKSWLFTVSRNECLMELRKHKNKRADLDQTLLLVADESDAMLQKVYAKEEQLNLLDEALTELKPDQRVALKLFYLENKSYEEVAGQMQESMNKVKSLIQNGKRNLKLKLETNE